MEDGFEVFLPVVSEGEAGQLARVGRHHGYEFANIVDDIGLVLAMRDIETEGGGMVVSGHQFV